MVRYSAVGIFRINKPTTKPKIRRATSEDSDQPAHPRNLISLRRSYVHSIQPPDCPMSDKREPLPYDLSLCCLHRFYCRFCRALAQIRLRNCSSAIVFCLDIGVRERRVNMVS